MSAPLNDDLRQALQIVASGYAHFDRRDSPSAVQQRCEELWELGYVEKHSDHDRENIVWYRLSPEGQVLMEQIQEDRWHDED